MRPLSFAAKMIVGGLLVAAIGVVVQIISGVEFPPVPPVFFILLVPAALVTFVRSRWTPITAVLAGFFLTVGLFLSGESDRLFQWDLVGGSAGLWIQTLGAAVALVAGVVAVRTTVRS